MSKHTPGPWHLQGYDLETLDFAVSSTGQMVDFQIYAPLSKQHPMPIASVQHCFNGKACEANAHLIAAAPTMYEALKQIEPILARMYGTQAKDLPPMQIVRAAIAKAEGA